MVLRRGTYGVFFGCSHFPRCRCTMPLAEGTFRLLQTNGMALYAVSRPCWKCGQPLRVRSYFPYFDLLQWLPGAEELLQPLEAIRLSIFPQLDAYLERHCDNIAERLQQKGRFFLCGESLSPLRYAAGQSDDLERRFALLCILQPKRGRSLNMWRSTFR